MSLLLLSVAQSQLCTLLLLLIGLQAVLRCFDLGGVVVVDCVPLCLQLHLLLLQLPQLLPERVLLFLAHRCLVDRLLKISSSRLNLI